MIKKNSICKLIKNVKTLITSDEFRTKHSLEDNAFTRNRKLSFQDIISFILGLPRKSLPTELDLFFEEKDFSVSKQAFSKARYKISSQAFEDIFKCQLTFFNLPAIQKHGTGIAYLLLTVLTLLLPIIKK